MANLKKQCLKAALYVRVSTEEQAEQGYSLEGQEDRLRAYCAFKGLEAVEVIVDPAQSAFKPLGARKGGKRLLALVKSRKVDCVLALKLDRLFRNTPDCLSVVSLWEKDGVALHLLDLGGQALDTSSAIGKFFLTIMAGVAELERNQTSERTKFALKQKVRSGSRNLGSNAPYGYRNLEDDLEPVPQEQEVLTLVRELRESGVTYRAICSTLEKRGFRNRAGSTFAPVQIERMLKGAKRMSPAE